MNTNKLNHRQWAIILVAVAAMWALSHGYEAYLKHDLEQYRVDVKIEEIQRQNALLEELKLMIEEAEAEEAAKNTI